MSKKEDYEEVMATPSITMFDHIEIQGKDTPIRIGGWNIEGFYLEEPYVLKEEKSKNLEGKDVTYYKIVKDKKIQSKREKKIREYKEKQRKDEIKYFETSIKDSKELIDNYTKKLKELKKSSEKKTTKESSAK